MAENIIIYNQVGEQAAAYLKQPYARLVMPESDGSFRGEILEFPGCIATGDSPSEAYAALEESAKNWLEAALARSQTIPDPVDASDFSGRMVLRIPRSLHKKASRIAERDAVSLNQFITVALAEYVGDRSRPTNFTFVCTIHSGVTTTYSGQLGGNVHGVTIHDSFRSFGPDTNNLLAFSSAKSLQEA
jgi:predicted HicB family RNase H-like nuclease